MLQTLTAFFGFSMPALQELLTRIVDYAGLFPPASLKLDEVIRNYESYCQSSNEWMLARVIIPAARLSEYASAAEEIVNFEHTQSSPWQVSALLPPPNKENFVEALAKIEDFNAGNPSRDFNSLVDTVEVLADVPHHIDLIARQLPPDIAAFIELPHANPRQHFEALSAAQTSRPNLYAKIRTGGVKPEMIPTVEQVADFLLAAAELGVGLKATAGLHHPVRREYPLTYDNDAPRAVMHGFLNVFMAACFALHQKGDRDALIELLGDMDPQAFGFESDVARWRDLEVNIQQIRQARERFAISFGSCSFTEPLEDLADLKLLENQLH